MKEPLGDELDAGGTISSVPYPEVLKDIKKQLKWKMFVRREWLEGGLKNRKGGAEAPPFSVSTTESDY
jgi:hypothetical protein